MASPTSDQQRSDQESREEFDTRMFNMVSRLEMTDTIFFYKLVSKSMVMEVVQGPFAYSLFPRDFINHHGTKIDTNVTFLTIDSHQTWPIKITVHAFKQSEPQVFAYGNGGWKAFLTDNHIKVGDVLIFSLIRFSRFEVLIVCRPSEVEHPENHFYLEKDVSLVVSSHFWKLRSLMFECDELQLKGPTKTITMVKVEKTYHKEVKKVRLKHSGSKVILLANNLAVGDVLEFSLVANLNFEVDVVKQIENL